MFDYSFNDNFFYSFSWRSTKQNLKKKKGKIYPLIPNCLKSNNIDNTKKWIYLVEGEYDAFSIVDIQHSIENKGEICEFSAISIDLANNLPRFIDEMYQNNIISNDIGLIIALDNDKRINQNVERFKTQGYQMAQKYKIPCIIADVKTLYLSEKDSNEALKKDRNKFEQSLRLTVEQAKLLDINTYMEECEQMEKKTQEQNNNVVAHHKANENNSTIEATSGNAIELPKWIYLSERGKKRIDEKEYCSYITNKLQIKTIKGKILTIDKELEESELEMRSTAIPLALDGGLRLTK